MKKQFSKILFFAMLFASISLYSQQGIEGVNNYGTEFVLSVIPNLGNDLPENRIRFYIHSFDDDEITVDCSAKNLSEKHIIKAGQTLELSYPIRLIQPAIKGGEDPAPANVVSRNGAVVIKSQKPVSIYVLSDFAKWSDGYLAIPLASLGSEYIVSSYPDASDKYSIYNSLPSMSSIIATENDTEVSFVIGGNASTKTAENYSSGEVLYRVLQKGDVWLISSKGAGSDLSGSRVISNKPVGVVSGNQCANIPLDNDLCDFLMTMEHPIYTWGKEYIVGSLPNKKFTPVIRIYASQPNTIVNVNGVYERTLSLNSGRFGDAYIEIDRYEALLNDVIYIDADKPINVVAYNTGYEEDESQSPRGGPSMITISPVEQFYKELTIATPINYSESNLDTYINLIIELVNDQIPDDFTMTQILAVGNKEYKLKNNPYIIDIDKLNYQKDGKQYAHIKLKVPNGLVFQFNSSQDFYSTSTGTSEFKTYNFSSKVNLKNIYANLDISAPLVTYKFDCAGNLSGEAFDESIDGKPAGLGPVFLDTDKTKNFRNLQLIRQPTGNELKWSLDIIDPRLDAKAFLKFYDRAVNITELEIDYKSLNITNTPSAFVKNSLAEDGIYTDNLTIYDNSENDEPHLVISGINFARKEESDLNLVDEFGNEVSLPIDFSKINEKELLLKLTFTPRNVGDYNDTIYFNNGCYDVIAVPYSASVIAPQIHVSEINFGDVALGAESTLPFRITNLSRADVVVYGFDGPNSPALTIETPTGTFPFTLRANSVMDYFVKYKPTQAEVLVDAIKIMSSAKGYDTVCVINGRSLLAGLTANSLDFGRVLTTSGMPSFQRIELINNGDNSIVINNIAIENATLEDVFTLPDRSIIGKEIKKGELVELIVGFAPKKYGKYEADIVFTADVYGRLETVAKLKGIGTIPKLAVNDINFGEVGLSSISNGVTIPIGIENLGLSQWEFYDEMQIIDIELLTNNISLIGEAKNTPFKLLINDLSIFTTIEADEIYNIGVLFSPEQAGLYEAKLVVSSSAMSRYDTITIGGIGLASKISVNFPPKSFAACPGQSDSVKITISNLSGVKAKLDPIRLENNKGDFYIDNIVLTENVIELEPNSSLDFNLVYQPIMSNISNVNVVIKEIASIEEVRNSYSSISLEQEVFTSMSPNVAYVEISDIVSIDFKITIPMTLYSNLPNNLTMLLTYSSDILNPDLSSIALSGLLSNYRVQSVNNNRQNNTLRVNLIRQSEINNVESGTIFTIKFTTLLPSSTEKTAQVIGQLLANEASCISFSSNISQITVNPYCGDGFRSVTTSNVAYFVSGLDGYIDSDVAIEVGVGLDGQSSLNIYDVSGRLVHSFIDGYTQVGKYSFQFSPKMLGNGAYFYTFISGPYVQSGKILINSVN